MELLSVIRRWRYRDHYSIREISRRTAVEKHGPQIPALGQRRAEVQHSRPPEQPVDNVLAVLERGGEETRPLNLWG
jgi:hypothetical protein